MSADAFEQAILAQYDPNTLPDRLQACEAFCSQQLAAHGIRRVMRYAYQTAYPRVRFYCIKALIQVILHNYEALSPEDKAWLRQACLAWVSQVALKISLESYEVKKFAQMVGLLFREAYPQDWPNFFTECTAWLSHGATGIRVFLRVIEAIDDVAVTRELNRNPAELMQGNEIKNAMRENGAVSSLMKVWETIMATYYLDDPPLVSLSMKVMSKYINWIDITPFASGNMPAMLFAFLQSPPLRIQAANCLYEICSKGMDPVPKLLLISTLNIIDHLNKWIHVEDETFIVKLGRIVGVVGANVLSGCAHVEQAVSEASLGADALSSALQLKARSLELLMLFLNHPSLGVVVTVLDFAQRYVQYLKQKPEGPELQGLQMLFQVSAVKMRYPDDYSFDDPDEAENQFVEMRSDFGILFKAMARLIQPEAVAWVTQHCAQVLPGAESQPFADTELALHLLSLLCEVTSQVRIDRLPRVHPGHASGAGSMFSGSSSKQPPGEIASFFADWLRAICVRYPVFREGAHPQVLVTAFSILNRYGDYLPEDAAFIQGVLALLHSPIGFLNATPRVVEAAVRTFHRLCDAQRSALIAFLPTIVAGTQTLLVVRPEGPPIPVDSQLLMYQSLGTLVANNTDVDSMTSQLERTFSPLNHQLDGLMGDPGYFQEHPVMATALVGHLIDCMGNYAKGFSDCGKRGASKVFFEKATSSVLAVLKALYSSDDMRARCLFFFHRMVDVLREAVIPFLAVLVPILMVSGGPKELIDFCKLLSQLMYRFRANLQPFLHDVIGPLFSRIFELISKVEKVVEGTPLSDEQREVGNLRKAYFMLLSQAARTDCASVLAVPENAGMLNGVLTTLFEGGMEYSDAGVQKYCLTIIRSLLKVWGTSLPVFTEWLQSSVAPLMVVLPFHERFNPFDGQASLALRDVSENLRALSRALPDHLLATIRHQLPPLGCSPAVVESYVSHLAGKPDDWWKYFEELVKAFHTNRLSKPK